MSMISTKQETKYVLLKAASNNNNHCCNGLPFTVNIWVHMSTNEVINQWKIMRSNILNFKKNPDITNNFNVSIMRIGVIFNFAIL